MKIMEYNIQSGRNYEENYMRNYDFALEVIRGESPDIVGLCEVGRQPSHIFPAYPLECEVDEYYAKELGMYSCYGISQYFSGYGYGNAILSKYPIKSYKTIKIPDVPAEKRVEGAYYESRTILLAELDVVGGLTVLVSHFGLVKEERENAVNTLLSVLKDIKTPIIFMGDLNLGPKDAFLDPVYQLLHEASGTRESIPLTIPSDAPKYKIDFIFASKEISFKDYKTISTRASDHLPYVAEIEI